MPAGVLEVTHVAGLVLVQDGGRPGRLHEGVPPGGPLVPELLARANRALGNDAGEAALEVMGALSLVVSEGPLWLATEEGHAACVRPGERIALAPSPASVVRYLAVGGGIDVPVVLGGRGTLLVAELGGYEGRPLRRGDRLRARPAPTEPSPAPAPAMATASPAEAWLSASSASPSAGDADEPIRVVPGPDGARFHASALATLTSSLYQVSPLTDRTGMRLDGPRLGRRDDDSAAPAPMVRGAIQVPQAGQPIVLGPDHPTTGGYPVIATVIRADLGRLAARRPGAAVRFVAVSAAEARQLWAERSGAR